MACRSLGSSTSSCFLFEWEPQLRYFGPGAAGVGAGDPDIHEHELELFIPECMEPSSSEASTAATGLPQDAVVMPGELEELLQSLWDLNEEQVLGFSSCCTLKETSTASSQHDRFTLSSISGPTLSDKTLARPEAEPRSSSSPHSNEGPRVSDTGGGQLQPTRANCSSKRQAPETGCGDSNKRSRKASCTAGFGTVAHPFTAVKPGGADGAVTLADINEWILTPPARPVRHPVGEFACAPRVSVGNLLAPSGKTVASFTRLHTAGRGTITIVRTRG